MAVSYKKLFKLLIDRDMKKKELKELSGIGNSTMTKLANNENVTVEVMAKICNALNCSMDDVIEILPDREEK
ncbi:DNA-binding Xre family transcriptional regulator [Catenibacillus scindens]|uniref:DNA-binding Xre family transcriptional regulator n=1 Tax=Catenibacillus scindens TaxID=673271 RepID=A0A7W8HEG9_9FIRM|nr:helix-turn-helix transcriptional regulator [Catenibacillus scindens]MBB5266240.1 DNA-binding Xre family transcriptional regulator [Catenibacillus scindens]